MGDKNCERCAEEFYGNAAEKHCYDCKQAIKNEIAALGGRRAWQEYTLEKFVVTPKNTDAVEAVKAFDPAKENLFIFGPVGTGKTHLATVAARNSKRRLGFLRQTELAREIRGCETANGEQAVIDEWVEKPVVLLDDLGAAKDTEFMVSLLFDIIDGRYRALRNGLIVTSNRTLDQLAEKLGEDRIPSRLAQMCKLIRLDGDDHRLEAKK